MELVATVEEVSLVATTAFVALQGALVYEWYAVKYRKAPTFTRMIQAVPLPLRILGIAVVNVAFFVWQIFHFDIT